MTTQQPCARCLRLREHLVRVSGKVFALFVGKAICALCLAEVLAAAAERLGLLT
jgi:hypothetical protein